MSVLECRPMKRLYAIDVVRCTRRELLALYAAGYDVEAELYRRGLVTVH